MPHRARALLLSTLILAALPALPAWAGEEAVAGDAADESAPAPAISDATAGGAASGGAAPAVSQYRRALPFMAEEALKRGYELPLPYGAALVVTGLGNRQIDVTDVRVGIQDSPQSVSQFLSLGATSDVFNANLKFDAWLLPFMNVYALIGYVHNNSTTHAVITVPAPGPVPGELQFEKDIKTELDGVVGGVGLALATGYKNLFLVADASLIKSDLGFDNKFRATIATVRAGYRGRINTLPLQMWLGVGNWDTATVATGHVELEGVGTLNFEADQQPHTPWMYDLGSNLEVSKRLQLVLDVGSDFQGGYFIVAGPTFRF